MPDTIPLKEFQSRREKLLRSLKGAVGLVFAGESSAHLTGTWRPHGHFEYLTGITDETGACILFDPAHPIEEKRIALLLRPSDPEVDKWDGYRSLISSKLKEETGFKAIYRTNTLPRWMLAAAKRSKRLACLHPLAMHTQDVSPDLAIFRRVAERIPGCAIEDQTEMIAQMRAAKSKTEQSLIQRAVDITGEAYFDMLRALKPGMNEFQIQELLEHGYRSRGSRGPLYGTIVGSGLNATVLHYRANDQELKEGDLVCIDSAAGFGGYSADITRTFPVGGKFTRRQREIYDLVLKAEEETIKHAKAGVTFGELDKVARDIIEKAGYGDYFIHGIGHHLGLEVHDVTPEGPIPDGAVITIEPGIYIPEENLGVRIEDDILVTKTGPKNLSAKIPKKASEIERIMQD